MDELKKALGEFTLGLLKMPFRIGQGVYRALVLTYLWAWFMVPGLGLHALTLPVAYGILLVLSLFYRLSEADMEARKKADHVFLTDMLFSVVQSSMTWGIGWLTHHFFF